MAKRGDYYSNLGPLGASSLTVPPERAYFESNFYSSFLTGFGTEYVMRFVKKHARGGTWLDLGSGPTSYFWSLSLPIMSSIVFSDISEESLGILTEFAESELIPTGYLEAGVWLGVDTAEVLANKKQALLGCEIIDIFKPWRSNLIPEVDLITAFGVMSLAKSERELTNALSSVSSQLSRSGIFVGASWILNQEHSAIRQIDNSEFTGDQITRLASSAGLNLIETATINPEHCDLYERIEAFAFSR